MPDGFPYQSPLTYLEAPRDCGLIFLPSHTGVIATSKKSYGEYPILE
jgi:hypothetical protein